LRVFRTIDEVRAWRRGLHGSVGLVPTMGYLHEGHLSLVREARRRDDHVVATIFVNPTQFAPNEDLARYPRDEASDLALLEREGVDAVFAPSVDVMYPDRYSTYVVVEGITQRLEGASRPTHFRGVTTVVLKLFNIVRPDRAYFGRKDAQQLVVIRRMACDLDLPIEIIGMPIVREADGLAMSSRNAYLTREQRAAAPVLARALAHAEQLVAEGERSATVVRSAVAATLETEPLAEVDYVSVADTATLDELERIEAPALLSLAVRFGSTRLIDNTLLEPR
jgi:pantoate--beta-alanine ligase